mmetsp:Transcript_26571/g.67647  ORF Transcript_26571/g.67647 Transcript_26571/m.67647 type:complete len:332 (-) Transcript_26571:453-1448(-)
MEEPAKESVEQTMEASSRMAMRMRSRSTRLTLPPLRSFSTPSRASTMASSATERTLWCGFTPMRTTEGAYICPSLSMRPLLMMRYTISSSALLEGAHTSTCALGPESRPTRMGARCQPTVSPYTASFALAGGSYGVMASLTQRSPPTQGACASHSRARSSSPSCDSGAPSRSWGTSFMSSSDPFCALCMTTDSRLRMVRVLPVPGGPWISTTGVPSSPARSASICDVLHCDSMVPAMPGGMSMCLLEGAERGLQASRVSMKGQTCACCSATHSLEMVDMLASLSSHQQDPGAVRPARMARTRLRPAVLPSCESSVSMNLTRMDCSPSWPSQ